MYIHKKYVFDVDFNLFFYEVILYFNLWYCVWNRKLGKHWKEFMAFACIENFPKRTNGACPVHTRTHIAVRDSSGDNLLQPGSYCETERDPEQPTFK